MRCVTCRFHADGRLDALFEARVPPRKFAKTDVRRLLEDHA
jgi:hypothetical protein